MMSSPQGATASSKFSSPQGDALKFRRDLKASALAGVFSLGFAQGAPNPVLIENTPAARE